VELKSPLHTQHNEGVGSCNGGNPNAAIRLLGRTAMKAEFPVKGNKRIERNRSKVN